MADTKKRKKKMSKKKAFGMTVLPVSLYDAADIATDYGMELGQALQGLGLFEKGGKIGKSPKGCGAALRGYGKAMKKGKKNV
mgnify:CR=1 FL=1|tara:strand:- start:230 stop:475 length:246 start_codon:yes stop_codon:yes gene_type:complete